MRSKLYILLTIGFLATVSSNAAESGNRHCWCQAVDTAGAVMHDFGSIDNYGLLETNVDNKCRESCVQNIQGNITLENAWNGGTWENASAVCGWTGGIVKDIRSKSKVATGSYTYADAINWTYSCSDEPCPVGSYFAPQTLFGPYAPAGHPPLTPYKNYAVIVKDGNNPVVSPIENMYSTTPFCPASLKASYKCVYHLAIPGVDTCIGVNPGPYTPGATPTIGETLTAVCPPGGLPMATTKSVDPSSNYYGVPAQSSLDKCRIPL